MGVTELVFSVESVARRAVGIRLLGKVLHVNEMLVPDRKHGLQMSIFSSAGHNMTTY